MPNDLFEFTPALPMTIWPLLSVFLTSSEGGRFRWGNVYGNTFIVFCGAFTSSLSTTFGNRYAREAAACGFLGGFCTMFFPLIGMVHWKRLIPVHVSSAIGAAYMSYYSYLYYQEVYAIEDAGEDF